MNTKCHKIKEIVKQSLSQNAFKVWIENLELSISEGQANTIHILVTSQHIAKKLEQDYGRIIVQAAEELGLHNAKLEIIIQAKQPEKAQNKPVLNNQSIPLNQTELSKLQEQYHRSKLILPENQAFLASSQQLQLPIGQTNIASFETKIANQKFSFENFVVGPCNELAFAAAQNILQNSHSADMLFLSSGTGLGKTHLAQALGQSISIQARLKQQSVAYLTAEEFASRFVLSMKQRNIEDFKNCFRSFDILILEDVHFLREKEKMQEELLATIRSLQNRGAKVILTSSFAPNDLQGVDSQLVSRFCSGFVAGINKPDFLTKKNIVLEKAKFAHINFPEHIAEILAKEINSDIRQLESCINTIVLKAKISGKSLNENMAYEALEQFTKLNPNLNIEQITELVCNSYEITKPQLESKSRRQDLVLARNLAFFLARKHTSLSLSSIGDYYNRKHSTVIKGIESIEKEISKQSPLGFQILHTLKQIERPNTFLKG